MDHAREPSTIRTPRLGSGLAARRLLVTLLVLPLLVAAWLTLSRYAEDSVLAAAQARLERGAWQGAAAELDRLGRLRSLSREGRRRTAALYFRLGDDRKANQLLAGIPYRENDPDDR